MRLASKRSVIVIANLARRTAEYNSHSDASKAIFDVIQIYSKNDANK